MTVFPTIMFQFSEKYFAYNGYSIIGFEWMDGWLDGYKGGDIEGNGLDDF